MCLLITVFAALVTSFVWYKKRGERKWRLERLALMYWGAALMWVVDGFVCLIEGEAFFDISMGDALLGVLVVVCGIVGWGISLVWKNPFERSRCKRSGV